MYISLTHFHPMLHVLGLGRLNDVDPCLYFELGCIREKAILQLLIYSWKGL